MPGILVGVLVFELMKVALQFMNVNSSYNYICLLYTSAPARTAGGRQPSPGARFVPNGTAPRKPKNDQQKENTAWKTSKKKK